MITPEQIRQHLIMMADPVYKRFQCRLMPTVDPHAVIGIPMPHLRKYAKLLKDLSGFYLNALPHRYYEENNLHGILISNFTDVDTAIAALDCFLPYVDNWATCDLIAPKVFLKHPAGLIPKVQQWINSEHTYTVRFGIGVLLRYYFDNAFESMYPEIVSQVRSQEYYVNMMTAWYFATALAKQYDAALPYIKERRLDPWTHNKTIQKAIESYRITSEQKEYLRTLKIKV